MTDAPTDAPPFPPSDIVADVVALRIWATTEHRADVLRVLDFLDLQSKLVVELANAARKNKAAPK